MYSFSIGQEHEKMYTSTCTNNSCFPVQPYVKIDTVLFNILPNLNKTLFHKHVGLDST